MGETETDSEVEGHMKIDSEVILLICSLHSMRLDLLLPFKMLKVMSLVQHNNILYILHQHFFTIGQLIVHHI